MDTLAFRELVHRKLRELKNFMKKRTKQTGERKL